MMDSNERMETMILTPSPTGADPLDTIAHALATDPHLRSPNTRRGYLNDLQAFEEWRAGRAMTKLLVQEYAAELQRAGRAASGINRALSAIRWWARRAGDLAIEDGTLSETARVAIVRITERVAAVENVRGDGAPKGRHLSNGELAALLDACAYDETPAGVRDAAIIALAWVTGMRREELATLELVNIHRQDSTSGGTVPAFEITVWGKGGKRRTAYADNGAAEALADWLALREATPGEETAGGGPLWYAIRKGGHVQVGRGVSDEALAQMLAKRAEEAGVHDLSWHDFRRTFAGNLLDAGVDLVTVQKLMGHASPATTSGYDRRGEEVKRKAVRNLHVPYRRRRA